MGAARIAIASRTGDAAYFLVDAEDVSKCLPHTFVCSSHGGVRLITPGTGGGRTAASFILGLTPNRRVHYVNGNRRDLRKQNLRAGSLGTVVRVENGLGLVPLVGKLGEGKVAVIDPADSPLVEPHRWYYGDGYAYARINVGSKWRTVGMHRLLLLGLEPGGKREVDHIDRNRLNNQRANLRIVSRAINSRNVPPVGASSYRGVSFHAASGLWRARAKVDGTTHHIGSFTSEAEAGAAAKAFRLQHMIGATD